MLSFNITEEFWGAEIVLLLSPMETIGPFLAEEESAELAEAVVDALDAGIEATTILLPSGKIFVWMPKIPETPAEHGTLGHELLHVTRFILSAGKGIPLNDDTEEVYAHTMGALLTLVWGRLQSTRILKEDTRWDTFKK